MGMAGLRTGIRRRYQELSKALDERGRRLFAASEARAYGHGGVSVVSRITCYRFNWRHIFYRTGIIAI